MVKVQLREYLDSHGVSAYALTKQAALAPNTVYTLARGDTKRLDLEVLAEVMNALEQLTGEPVTFNDLLERQEIKDEQQDLAEAGLADYSQALSDLEADVPTEALTAWGSAFEKASKRA